MTTDFQRAREALGARMRDIRTEGGVSGRTMAKRLGWPPSKVSKLETGKQTPTPADLDAWATAADRPEAAAELQGRLRGLETNLRSWRRQLSGGYRPRQDEATAQERVTESIRAYEATVIPGMLQTPDYARHLLQHSADLRQAPRDIDAGVLARMKRQEALYRPGRMFHALLWEAALRVLACPPEVMAGQLDRLAGLIGMPTVQLGIIPLGVPMTITPRHGFWIYDERLVIVETITAEMWLDDADDIAMYGKVWERLDRAAVYGSRAHRVIAAAAAALRTA
ncbi:helix-turn-helix domain-containing protein [Kitasatospora sp. GAS1066B]|uniref:helix-turn-helix domain-containing protein n=1 Tax=Kitasatospora sp. GAS1066B TaxID=3156271 RepID=UPI0035183C3D